MSYQTISALKFAVRRKNPQNPHSIHVHGVFEVPMNADGSRHEEFFEIGKFALNEMRVLLSSGFLSLTDHFNAGIAGVDRSPVSSTGLLMNPNLAYEALEVLCLRFYVRRGDTGYQAAKDPYYNSFRQPLRLIERPDQSFQVTSGLRWEDVFNLTLDGVLHKSDRVHADGKSRCRLLQDFVNPSVFRRHHYSSGSIPMHEQNVYPDGVYAWR
jgi:hypothetical protein